MRWLWIICLPMVLIAGEKQAFLGIALGTENEAPDAMRGVRVMRVVEGHGAHKAGIRMNDRLLKLEGVDIRSDDDIVTILAEHMPGDLLTAILERELERFEVSIELGEMPANNEIVLPFVDENLTAMLKLNEFWLGLDGHDLSPALAAHFCVKSGVLVNKVHAEGPAIAAGLEVGDIILGVAEETLTSKADLAAILRRFEAGSQVVLKVQRSQKVLEKRVKLVLLTEVPEAYQKELLESMDLKFLENLGDLFGQPKSQ